MRDYWRLSGIAVAFVVLLRLAIGWQFVYEGLWKLNTFSSAKPWTAAGYLRNARGPLRETYRKMSGDPDDLRWLDYDAVAASFDAYKNEFVAHYPDLTDTQKTRLSELLDGPERFAVPLAKLPPQVTLTGTIQKVVTYDPDAKLLIVDGKKHLLPKEKAELEKLVRGDDSPDAKRFLRALNAVSKQSSHLSCKERLAVLLKIDPERTGQIVYDDKTREVVEQRKGKVAQYKDMLSAYEQQLPKAREEFEHKHLATQWEEIQKLRADLVNPVRAMETEFQQEARKLLDVNQLARGPVSMPWTQQQWIDRMTIWGLIGLGALLLVGLFSRAAAAAAALLLLSFYLAVPPWPGVEELIETAGPEHSFLINKNLIEVIALLGIMCMPTGQWFGLDRLIFRNRNRNRQLSTDPVPSSPSSSLPRASSSTEPLAQRAPSAAKK